MVEVVRSMPAALPAPVVLPPPVGERDREGPPEARGVPAGKIAEHSAVARPDRRRHDQRDRGPGVATGRRAIAGPVVRVAPTCAIRGAGSEWSRAALGVGQGALRPQDKASTVRRVLVGPVAAAVLDALDECEIQTGFHVRRSRSSYWFPRIAIWLAECIRSAMLGELTVMDSQHDVGIHPAPGTAGPGTHFASARSTSRSS